MRKRLLALFVVTTTAVGCSLALDFDRGQIPDHLQPGASGHAQIDDRILRRIGARKRVKEDA